MSAKEVIHTVLFDQLSEKTYNAQDAIQWTKDIADIIREKIKGEVSLLGLGFHWIIVKYNQLILDIE